MAEDKANIIAKERRGFYIHFAIYILVNIFLIWQWWYLTNGDSWPWFIPATGGWGIGIIAHFLGVFVFLKK